MLVIKSFVSLKEWVFAIFDEGTFQGGSEVLKLSSFAFLGVEGGGGQKRVRSTFQGGADTPENTMMDFLKVIYENVEKKTIHFATITSINTGFEVLWSFILYIL